MGTSGSEGEVPWVIPGIDSNHSGIDFGASQGSPIYAFEAGLVEFVGSKGGYGKAVIINHGAGKSTLYGHASKLSVRKGEHINN